jgi:nucleoside-diphosphate-sugar epimerase
MVHESSDRSISKHGSRVIVVGGSGFIGTRLCYRLKKEGSDFLILDKQQSPYYPENTGQADVRSLDGLLRAVPEGGIIINLAAEHKDNVRPISLYDEVNVGGAKSVCQVAREKHIDTIIFTSSVAVYGFAPVETGESGALSPFNDYGRTKMEAEALYKNWQAEDSRRRALVIVRPTVVFGERNRGNVYNLLKQIASGRFTMIGNGRNVKSMAYVENVAAFLQYSLTFPPGLHIYNYIDKPDFDMNTLIATVYQMLGMKGKPLRIPYAIGMFLGKALDLAALATGRSFAVSSIRVKKFCSNSMFDTSVASTGFTPPVSILEGLRRTIFYEFIEHHDEAVFYSE